MYFRLKLPRQITYYVEGFSYVLFVDLSELPELSRLSGSEVSLGGYLYSDTLLLRVTYRFYA